MKKLIEFLDSELLKPACLVFMLAAPFFGVQFKISPRILFAVMLAAFAVLCASVVVSVYRDE